MPIPTSELLHQWTDAVLAVVRKANELGVAVETAVQAFHDKYFEQHEPDVMRSTGAYSALPPEMQAAVDEQVAGVGQS